MGIIQDRLSTTFVDADYIPPEERFRATLLVDYEGGPLAITDTSKGLNHQNWALSYMPGGDVILTPESEGMPYTAINVVGASQLTFCFDQNARPSLAWVIGANMFHYWYDSNPGEFVTTEYTGVNSVILSLDDKRRMQNSTSDMLLWYTVLTGPAEYTLYHRKQRDRFQTPYTMKVGVLPYLSKAGMHRGLRGKIATRAGVG